MAERLIHYGTSCGPYRHVTTAPCGATIIAKNPDKVEPQAIAIHQVTCPACKVAIRRMVREFTRARRAGTIPADWGRS